MPEHGSSWIVVTGTSNPQISKENFKVVMAKLIDKRNLRGPLTTNLLKMPQRLLMLRRTPINPVFRRVSKIGVPCASVNSGINFSASYFKFTVDSLNFYV